MKFLIFIIFFITQDLGWTIPIGEQINITRNLCFQTTGMSPDNMHGYNYPDTEETYRYMRCVFENLELWSEADGIENDRIGEILEGQRNRNTIMYAIKECNEDSRTENTDVWLYKTVDCIANGNISAVLNNILTAS